MTTLYRSTRRRKKNEGKGGSGRRRDEIVLMAISRKTTSKKCLKWERYCTESSVKKLKDEVETKFSELHSTRRRYLKQIFGCRDETTLPFKNGSQASAMLDVQFCLWAHKWQSTLTTKFRFVVVYMKRAKCLHVWHVWLEHNLTSHPNKKLSNEIKRTANCNVDQLKAHDLLKKPQ